MRAVAALAAWSALTACGPAERGGPEPPARPMRVVSLDFCADQYVLKLIDGERILAVSPDADASYSYMRDAAEGLATVRPLAEDVLLLKPDVVVRSYGGGPNASAFFARAGIPVVQVGWASDFDGVRRVLQDMGAALGETARARTAAMDMDRRLAAIRPRAEQTALYMTPGGVTAGPGTLIDALLQAAGLRNFEREPGWRDLPLERLAYEAPDMVAAAFFDEDQNHETHWSAARHPLARAQLRDRPTVSLQGAWTACGGWFLLDAAEALAAPSEARIAAR